MLFDGIKFLPLARIFSLKVCRASLHLSEISNNSWRRRDSTSEMSDVIHSPENCGKELDRESKDCVSDDFLRKSPQNVARLFGRLNMNQARNISNTSINGDDKFHKIEIDMEGTKPEDISITLRGNELKVTAYHGEKQADGSRYVREHTYHYTLPSEIDPDTVRSRLSNGILTIQAPLPALESKEISINIENKEK